MVGVRFEGGDSRGACSEVLVLLYTHDPARMVVSFASFPPLFLVHQLRALQSAQGIIRLETDGIAGAEIS